MASSFAEQARVRIADARLELQPPSGQPPTKEQREKEFMFDALEILCTAIDEIGTDVRQIKEFLRERA